MRGSNGSLPKWDQEHLDRTQRALQAWTTRDPGAAKTETAASAGAGTIDDFRLRGSSRCRRMGVTLLDGGGDIEG